MCIIVQTLRRPEETELDKEISKVDTSIRKKVKIEDGSHLSVPYESLVVLGEPKILMSLIFRDILAHKWQH